VCLSCYVVYKMMTRRHQRTVMRFTDALASVRNAGSDDQLVHGYDDVMR
jgi:hypothetical protein